MKDFETNKNKVNTFAALVIAILGGLALVAISLFFGAIILAFPLKWLWNFVMPFLFGLPEIGYWKAFALFILCGLLFKGNTNTRKNEKN